MPFLKLTSEQITRVNDLNESWIESYIAQNPHDTITQRYCEAVEFAGYYYVIKDAITEQYITDYVEILEELPVDNFAPWHFPTAFRIVQSNVGMIRMLKDIPQLALYPSQAGLDVVEYGNYQYTYINYILPEHEQVFSIQEYEATIQSQLTQP